MINKNLSHLLKGSILALCLSSPLYSLEVNIKKDLPYVDVDVNGENIRIQRIQDTSHKLTNSYVKTSRQSPPFIIQPFVPIEGIETVTELDVMEFIKKEVSDNEGILLDARMPKWYENGTIPGALNIPFSILSPKEDNQYINQIFNLLGVEKDGKKWNFDFAQKLLVFDNGPWCQQGVHAMKSLVKLGYPKSKIFYYRGGMQFWQILGLSTYKTK